MADAPPTNPDTAEAKTVKDAAKLLGPLVKVRALRNHFSKIKHGKRGLKSSYTVFDLKKGEIYEIHKSHVAILNQQANPAPDRTVELI